MAKSILHNKSDRTCYLCMKINGDYARKSYVEEHHVMSGTANRKLSERYGLKVYLCIHHHRTSDQAVHKNMEMQRCLQQEAQRAFEAKYSHELWMQVFGRNFI